ncbi:FliG C-terminal domain-containing protein [Sporosalibacterium faouarense]|uniref:FliG C-terminal domain-containing protein n=1 Tax=Sporosalibacterium faouarense TaxID=516123 RepID=UPI00141D44A5|nr:FliG C-terminal domain-containing protein [Sporosalibacterium faouarense]MTI47881.1 hypothetical protein [Bacillota bacterium]
MRIPIISIGNSKGIRIPQAILKQCNADKEFELEVEDNQIVLKTINQKSYDLSFNNISNMTDKEIQNLLYKVNPTTLSIALIDCDESTQNRIFTNLSQKACKMIKNEIERLSQMDAKQLIIEMHRAKIDSELSNMIHK